ncbi:MAG: ABC transporter substrate-binding protein [Bacteroidales bacterium]|nr:ABC transporter substrate-binding protein [Bacteroidales bacterium]
MRQARYLIIIFAILAASCISGNHDNTLHDPLTNKYSERFIIERYDGYSKLTVLNPWQGAGQEYFEYYIADSVSKIPAGVEKSKIVVKPVQKIICTSTTHISMLQALGASDLVTGVSGSDFVYNKELRQRINQGLIYDIGYESGYNVELIYSLGPDLILVYGVGSESVHTFSRLADMGIPVIYIADYLENHPLARTEWIKVIGELLGRQEKAEGIFDSVSNEYNNIVEIISVKGDKRPRVLLGLPFKDKWFISPGNSYISRLIQDAGGQYLWADSKSDVSIPMSMEAVCIKAVDADIWLNPGAARTIKDIHSVDHRLADLQVASEGSVFNNIKRLNEYGGNDYWESGTVNPHLLLKDIASIINPALFPDHDLVYYTALRNEAPDRKW